MTEAELQEISGRTHICDVCGRAGIWGPTWSWYGTVDEVKAKFCSSDCQVAFSKNGKRLPLPARALQAILAEQKQGFRP